MRLVQSYTLFHGIIAPISRRLCPLHAEPIDLETMYKIRLMFYDRRSCERALDIRCRRTVPAVSTHTATVATTATRWGDTAFTQKRLFSRLARRSPKPALPLRDWGEGEKKKWQQTKVQNLSPLLVWNIRSSLEYKSISPLRLRRRINHFQ